MHADRIAWLNHPTRRRMLQAAEQSFAEVGYDLARVDDIAGRAGVSKSHLYYHFPSKAALLSALVELRQDELLTRKDEILRDLAPQDLEGDTADLAAVLRRFFTEVLQPQQRFLRIVLIEVLKGSEAVEPVIAAFTHALEDSIDRFSELGVALDPVRAKPLLFQLGLVPALFAVAVDPSKLGLDLQVTDLADDLAVLEQSLIRTLRKDTP
ncbi:MAG TPA: helix-turn-helix domain-containing protein [Ruania sp.]|nr:helix-turn-helix domain-containing protein [Ruania sp.]